MGRALLVRLHGQSQHRDAARFVFPILELETSAVVFGDLATQHQTDAGAGGFGGEEGYKQAGGFANSRAFIRYPELDHLIGSRP